MNIRIKSEGSSISDTMHAQVQDKTKEGTFPPFDASTYPSQIFWLVITFGFFYLFLKNVILSRITSILEVRHTRLDKDMRQAIKMKEEADAIIASYEVELAKAKLKANQQLISAREKAKAEAEKKQKKIIEELKKNLSESEKQIDEEKLRIKDNIEKIAEPLASLIAQKLIVKKNLDHTIINVVNSLRK